MNLSSDLMPRACTPSRTNAFTLVELLVVISIIAILAGLLLPVVNKVSENARKTTAKSAVTQIVSAVNNYQTDYGQYPVLSTTANGSDYTFGTDGHNSVLMLVLRALNANATDGTNALNSRRIVYFEGKNVKNTVNPKDGFVQAASGKSSSTPAVTFNIGDFVDPWGNCYLVRIDTGYSNAVQNPYADGSTVGASTNDSSGAADASLIHMGVAAFTYGFDGKLATGGTAISSPYTSIGDDVVSWQ